jgi:hypothetical protein
MRTQTCPDAEKKIPPLLSAFRGLDEACRSSIFLVRQGWVELIIISARNTENYQVMQKCVYYEKSSIYPASLGTDFWMKPAVPVSV